jgi:hypothetical protein
MEVGSWKMEVGRWKLEDGRWKSDLNTQNSKIQNVTIQ